MYKLSLLSSLLCLAATALADPSVWNNGPNNCTGPEATNWNTYPIGLFDGQVPGCQYFIASSGQAGPPTTFKSVLFDTGDVACNLTIYSIANCKGGVAQTVQPGKCASIPDGTIAAFVKQC